MATATLQILSGENAGRMVMIEGQATIGRDADSTIRINDRSISRKHAVIEGRGESFFLKDLASNNGTRLNGEKVTEAPLPEDCRIHFGAIETQFTVVGTGSLASDNLPAQFFEGAGGGEDWQAMPNSGNAGLDDIFRPSTLDEVDEREAAKKAEARKKLFDLAYVLAMIAVVVIGVILYIRIDLESRIPQQEVVLAEKQEILINYLGNVRFAHIIVENDEVVHVREDSEDNWWMLRVRGLSVGETRVRFTSGGRTLGVLTAIVKGEPNPQPRTNHLHVPEHERIARAEMLLRQGDSLEAEEPWQALQSYKEAIEWCRAIIPTPEAGVKAAERTRAVELELNTRIERLMDEARKTRRTIAPFYLNQIMRLIPDNNDLRHQRARNILLMHYPEYLRPAGS